MTLDLFNLNYIISLCFFYLKYNIIVIREENIYEFSFVNFFFL